MKNQKRFTLHRGFGLTKLHLFYYKSFGILVFTNGQGYLQISVLEDTEPFLLTLPADLESQQKQESTIEPHVFGLYREKVSTRKK